MKLRYKIISGYLLTAVLASLAFAFLLIPTSSLQNEYRRMNVETLPLVRILEELKITGLQIQASTSQTLLLLTEKDHFPVQPVSDQREDSDHSDREGKDLGEIEEGYTRVITSLAAYENSVYHYFQHEIPTYKTVSAKAKLLIARSRDLLQAQKNGPHNARLIELSSALKAAEEDFVKSIDSALAGEMAELAARNEHVESSINHSSHFLLAAILMALLLSVAGGALLAGSIARPIERLRMAAIGIRQGDFAVEVKPAGRDEIAQLTRSFVNMAGTLKTTQETLRKSRDYSDAILNSMAEALIVVSLDGTIDRGNPSLNKLLACDEEMIHGCELRNILPDPELYRENTFRWLMGTETRMEAETFLQNRLGERIPIRLLGSRSHDPTTDESRLILIAQDIRERRNAEEKLRANRRFLETILDNMIEEICIIDPETYSIVRTNRTFRDSYAAAGELLGRPCYEVTHGLSRPCTEACGHCPVEDALRFKTSVTCIHTHYHNDIEQFYEIQVAPIIEPSGEIHHMIHVARNITEQKQSEQALRESARQLEENNRQLACRTRDLEVAHRELQESQSRILQQDKMASIGQLAAGVAHEINNPMGFIISNLGSLEKYLNRLIEFSNIQAEQLSEQAREKVAAERKRLKIDYLLEDIPELLEESLDGAERVKKIVQDLKGFSRVDQAEFATANLNECIESTINIVWNEIKYNATLERDFQLEEVVPCYAQQFAQVMLNLLVNASHAIEGQGVIRIATRREDDDAVISVSDTGKGMDTETQKRIFEPFFTTKEVGKGTGLGLSIVYDIIKAHNGEISVDSTPGEGTTFSVRLPLNPQKTDSEAEKIFA